MREGPLTRPPTKCVGERTPPHGRVGPLRHRVRVPCGRPHWGTTTVARMQVPTTGGHKGPLLQVMRFLFQKTYPSKDPCGRPAVAVWADLTPMGLVPHNGSMPHATPARCKHPRPTTVRTSPPKNLPVQRCQVRASGLQSSQQVGDAPVKLWKQWHEQVKQMFVCC